MNGWILVYKKIWDNPLLRKRPKALAIWLWLLTHCDDEGVVTCGRNQISADTGVDPNTVYYWLKKFTQRTLDENQQLINIKTNNEFTTILILKFKELQRKTNKVTRRVLTTNQQQTNTNKEIKNKEERNISKDILDTLQEKFPTKSVFIEYEKYLDYLSSTGKTYKDYQAMFRNWLRRSDDSRIPPKPDHLKVEKVPEVKDRELTDEQKKAGLENLKKFNRGDLIKKM